MPHLTSNVFDRSWTSFGTCARRTYLRFVCLDTLKLCSKMKDVYIYHNSNAELVNCKTFELASEYSRVILLLFQLKAAVSKVDGS